MAIHRSAEVERLAQAIHDAAHEKLRCDYQCEFWHSICVATAQLMPEDFLEFGVRFAPVPVPA